MSDIPLMPMSLREGCEFYITLFLSNHDKSYDSDFKLYIPKNDATIEQLKTNLEPLLNFFNTHIPVNSTYPDHIKIINDETIKMELWIKRTYLLYQLLIYASVILSHKSLYDAICIPYYSTLPGYDTNDMFAFKDVLLDCIKLFNFGSMNYDSDIDISFEYICSIIKDINRKPILSYVIACIESMFIIFIGKSSLAFDIEYYGNFLTLTSKSLLGNLQNKITHFYTNTTQLTREHLKDILSPVISGMLRNIILGYMTISDTTLTEIQIRAMLKKDFTDGTLLSLINYTLDTIIKDTKVINYLKTIKDELESILNDTEMYENALNKTLRYLLADSATASLLYYNALNKAEQDFIEKTTGIYNSESGIYNITKLPINSVVSILSTWGEACIYKMENYINLITVLHVVRFLQEKKSQLNTYKKTTPRKYCSRLNINKRQEAYCLIGKYGYFISVLEQIGYLIRFHMVYCKSSHKHENTCKKKEKKYLDRLISAIELTNQHNLNIPTVPIKLNTSIITAPPLTTHLTTNSKNLGTSPLTTNLGTTHLTSNLGTTHLTSNSKNLGTSPLTTSIYGGKYKKRYTRHKHNYKNKLKTHKRSRY
jgi:hypothetical protein